MVVGTVRVASFDRHEDTRGGWAILMCVRHLSASGRSTDVGGLVGLGACLVSAVVVACSTPTVGTPHAPPLIGTVPVPDAGAEDAGFDGGPPQPWASTLYEEFEAQGPTGRAIGDFSFAGYGGNGSTVPRVPGPVFDVAAYGAVPDDELDDTVALQAAIEAAGDAGGGVVQLGPGRYRVHSTHADPYLVIDRDGVVLRGAGSGEDGTTLYLGVASTEGLVRRLGTVEDAARSHVALAITGRADLGPPVCLTENAPRGATEVTVEDTLGLRPGALYALILTDPGTGDLGRLLTTPFATSDETWETRDLPQIDWWVRVATVDDGRHVTLAQPTRLDIDLGLSPCLHEVSPVREVGVEHLRVSSAWPGGFQHHRPYPIEPASDAEILRSEEEQDYRWGGIFVSRAVDSWIQDVVVHDVTQAVVLVRAKDMVVSGLSIEGTAGHAGLAIAASHDVLVEDLALRARRVHNIEILNWSSGNVIRNATAYYEGWDPESQTGPWLDGHGLGAHENLYEGLQGLYFQAGGDHSVMPHLGVRNVLWNMRAPTRIEWEPRLGDELLQTTAWRLTSGSRATAYELFPGTIVVGAHRDGGLLTLGQSGEDRDDEWLRVEGLNRPLVQPQSLYEAQRTLHR